MDSLKKELCNVLEAALFSAETPLSLKQLYLLFPKTKKPSREEILEGISMLMDDYSNRGVELTQAGGGYRFQTRAVYADWLRRLNELRPPRYSKALLETLAIIAYRQPVTRGDIEEIRGVTVTTEIMRALIDREWIHQVGVRSVPGHPALYETTPEFLRYFGLKALEDLPELEDPRAIGDIVNDLNLSIDHEFNVLEDDQKGKAKSVEESDREFMRAPHTSPDVESSQIQKTEDIQYDDVTN